MENKENKLVSAHRLSRNSLSASVDGDFKTSRYAVGIDRNDAAKPTQKAGEAVAHVQAESPEEAKGHRGRRSAAFELPVHRKEKPNNLPMKSHIGVLLSVLAACAPCMQAQEASQTAPDTDELLPIPSTVFVPPPPPKEVPPLVVEASATRVLPTHQITVLRGEASTLPDIPPPPEPKPPVPGSVGEPRYLLSFGATVYDHHLSHVKWFDPRTKQQFEAWCSWDWTLLSPIPDIKLGAHVRPFFLLASNIDTELLSRSVRRFEMPQHPELEENAFAITKGDADDAVANHVLTTLRDFYIKHKDRLVLIRQAREDYQAAADAWHAANPPQPQSHTFWLKPHRGSRYLKQEGAGR
jgi:hypothetical protein